LEEKMSSPVSDFEKQLTQRFACWLKRAGSHERFTAAVRNQDKRELDRLLAEAFSIELPSWEKAIARVNDEATLLPRIVPGTSQH
jgi:hypothetical protein